MQGKGRVENLSSVLLYLCVCVCVLLPVCMYACPNFWTVRVKGKNVEAHALQQDHVLFTRTF